MPLKLTERAPTWYLQSSLAGVVCVQNGQKQMPIGLNQKILILFNAFVVETVSHYQCCFILDFHMDAYDLTLIVPAGCCGQFSLSSTSHALFLNLLLVLIPYVVPVVLL